MLYRNKLEVIGNIGRVEVSATNGRKIARVSVAINNSKKNRETGERKTYTDWVELVFFHAPTVSFIERYAEKGAHVAIEGKVKQISYEKADGTRVFSTECIGFKFDFVQPKADQEEAPAVSDDDIPL